MTKKILVMVCVVMAFLFIISSVASADSGEDR